MKEKKMGLLCPVCHEELATIANGARVDVIITCLECQCTFLLIHDNDPD